MEYFNKKQDVIDLQLTSYGKQLLSRGLFKPVYYAFSDDGVLYDHRWVSGTVGKELQSSVEQRIQEETPRLKTQHTKIGADRGIFNLFNSVVKYNNLIDLFEFTDYLDYYNSLAKIKGNPDFANSEKLLENMLGTKEYFNQYNPAWNVLLYNGKISDSTPYYKKNDITTLVPQLNCTLEDTVYKLDPDTEALVTIPAAANLLSSLENATSTDDEFDPDPDEDWDPDNWLVGEPQDVIPFVEDNFFEQFDVEDGSLFIIKDFLFVSVEELNSPYTDDNFSIEVFEVTTTEKNNNGEESLQKMYFSDYSTGPYVAASAIELVFNIEVDKEVENQLACSLIGRDKQIKNQSVYNSNIYDCAPPPDESRISIDPYAALPPVEPEDVC